MSCKGNKQRNFLSSLLVFLFLIHATYAQHFVHKSAPSGSGDQILQALAFHKDTLVMAITGSSSYTWDSISFTYPDKLNLPETVLIKTTINEKYPLNLLVFQSAVDKVDVKHIIKWKNGYLVSGTYVNALFIDGKRRILNMHSSSGFFILKLSDRFKILDIAHYEGGNIDLPHSIHLSQGTIFIPISITEPLYFQDTVVYSPSLEIIVVLSHSLNDLASANVFSLEDCGRMSIGDCAILNDTLLISGNFNDSIVATSRTVYNIGTFPDPFLLRYVGGRGVVEAMTFGGSYVANADRLLVNGDTLTVAGNFVGNLIPDAGTSVSVGERPGVYAFNYVKGRYLGGQILSSNSQISLSSILYDGGKLFMGFSFVDKMKYKQEKLIASNGETHFGLLEVSVFNDEGELYLFPYRGNGNFPFLKREGNGLEIYGTCNGMNFKRDVATEGFDIIRLRKGEYTSIQNKNDFLEEMSIYPQPANDIIHIKGISEFPAKNYRIYNMMGEIMQEGIFTDKILLNATIPRYSFLVVRNREGKIIGVEKVARN